MTRYVVLYGPRGVSREFHSLKAAEKHAQVKANQRKEKVSIDRVTTFSRSHWSQAHEKYINPNKSQPRKRRVVRRVSGFGLRLPRF